MDAATTGQPTPSAADATRLIAKLETNIGSVLFGKPRLIRFAVVALLAEGHLLVEDVPGVGKTLLAKALARSLGCEYHRIQCTPDLLPSDLIGTSIFRQDSQDFKFQPGPLFAQVVLADEINRATPRTQSALFEAMSERQVSVDGATHPLGPPFMVLATQNPFEYEGTYPLPESQLDRFLMRVSVGYPDRQSERAMLSGHRTGEPVDSLGSVLSVQDVLGLQSLTRATRIEPAVADYVLDVCTATRQHPRVSVGASPRAGLALYRAAQSLARADSRDFVLPDDVKVLAPVVLAHRLQLKGTPPGGAAEEASAVIAEILEKTPVPR
ncbi:MAG: MoxR family ATPase [Gemmataceae bacterium]|nr:MoxR family ATPase [Gemmataceae bacterium]